MDDKPIGSVSLDADNLWSYLKTHGDPSWTSRPSYLGTLSPRVRELYGTHGITGTIFMVGFDATREDGAAMVADLVAEGHEIGNHSFEHEPWLHEYSRQQLDDELARTESALEAAGAPRPRGFRGPGFSLSAELLELLHRRGYSYDCTTLPTWIGPLARAYYMRSSSLSDDDLKQRSALFGSATEVLRPVGPYRWSSTHPGNADPANAELVELPVTTMPGFRVPIHASYLIHLHSINPRIARAYVAAAVAALRIAKVAPSVLLHPLDLLGADEAPGLQFFPGMALPAAEKVGVVDHLLQTLRRHYELRTTSAHAEASRATPLRSCSMETAGPGAARRGLRREN